MTMNLPPFVWTIVGLLCCWYLYRYNNLHGKVKGLYAFTYLLAFGHLYVLLTYVYVNGLHMCYELHLL